VVILAIMAVSEPALLGVFLVHEKHRIRYRPVEKLSKKTVSKTPALASPVNAQYRAIMP